MEKLNVSVDVAKEPKEAFALVAKFIYEWRKATKDGFQPGSDLPVVLLACVNDFGVGLVGVDKIFSEYSQDPLASNYAFALGLAELVDSFVKPV